jgi:hypothetical protein
MTMAKTTTTTTIMMMKKDKKKIETRTFVMLLYLVLLPSSTTAWGELGHEIVANLAWHLLATPTQDKIANLLNITNTTLIQETGSPLAAVSNWADHVRHFLPWSSELHYIDIRDNLISGGCHYRKHQQILQQVDDDWSLLSLRCDECTFEYDRDCPEDICVAGAILNYSTQLILARQTKPYFHLRQNQTNRTSQSTYRRRQQQQQQQQQQALKFLIQ